MAAAIARRLLVDVHTHVYLPRYAALLRSRSAVPRIVQRPRPDAPSESEDRLVIFKDEPASGRPVGPQYWDREEKLKFMDAHGIDVSIVSSANPWLDFLPAVDACALAAQLNDDLDAYCASSPSFPLAINSTDSTSRPQADLRRLYGFGLLPLAPDVDPPALLEAAAQVAALPHLRGVILGTRGLGRGLDDPALEPLWAALAENGLVVFLHPHYGVDKTAFGGRENGHVLPLALGFPFETTIAITRLILAGVLDRHPSLRILLAHSGGALPALSSRLASCIAHDPIAASRLQHDARFYLGQLYFDAVAYGAAELGFVSEVVARAGGYAKDAKGAMKVDRAQGSRRMLFGTDHPFFPPLGTGDKWRSVVENLEAIEGVYGWSDADKDGVRGGNALELFDLLKL